MKKKILALGPKGTNGHEAAKKFIARCGRMEIELVASNKEILRGVLNGIGQFGVVPVENSSTGFIRDTIGFWLSQNQNFDKRGLYVIGELSLPIKHCLLVNRQVKKLNQVAMVSSHPEALSQCAEKLSVLGLDCRQPASSTAAAAQSAMENIKVAAIASAFAAQTYRLKIWDDHLQDCNGNVTRFHLLGKKPAGITGEDKTAVIFWLKDQPGELHRATGIFDIADINMSSIHSVPCGQPGEFAFYVEFDGHRQDPIISSALNLLENRVDKLIILGSFPKEAQLTPAA